MKKPNKIRNRKLYCWPVLFGMLLLSTGAAGQDLILSLAPKNLDCYGDGTGQISATWVGGTPPFTVYLNGSLYQENVTTPFVFVILDAGTYNIKVTDANESADDADVTITQPDEMICEITEVPSSDGEVSNGTATVLVSGGIKPYTYTWKDEFGAIVGRGAYATGHSGGINHVIVVDANGCETFVR